MRHNRAVTPDRTFVESALRHPRESLAVVLIGIPLVCWIWVLAMARDMYGPMTGAAAWMMSSTWDLPRILLLWAMWAAMMAGMMLPSAAPIVLLYARTMRTRAHDPHPQRSIYALTAGYLLIWAGFSAAATALQRLLATVWILTPMMEPARPATAAGLLFLAGAYQFTPLKHACLDGCRSPIVFLTSRWREGAGGAFRLGAEHGVYCLGCCWALMLLLFAGGVMNLTVILALTAWVALEKLAPFGRQSARVSGALLLAAGVWVLFR